MLEITTKPATQSNTVQLGDLVEVHTAAYGWQVGVVVRIGISPYYTEEIWGTQRAFVVSQPGYPVWTDYVAVSDLKLAQREHTCCDCGHDFYCSELCPECGFCLSCCDCGN